MDQSARSLVPEIVLVAGAYVGCMTGLDYGGRVLFGAAGVGEPPNQWVFIVGRTILAALLLALLLVVVRRHDQSFASLGLRRDRPIAAILWGIVASVTVLAAIYGVFSALHAVWPATLDLVRNTRDSNLSRLPKLTMIGVPLLSLVVAIGEELLFRGYLLTRLRALTGSWTLAVLLSAAAFAGLHFRVGWVAVVMILVPGILLGLWMIWRRDLLTPIVAHLFYDSASLTMLFYDTW